MGMSDGVDGLGGGGGSEAAPGWIGTHVRFQFQFLTSLRVIKKTFQDDYFLNLFVE